MDTVRSRMWGRINSWRRGGRLIIQQSPEFLWLEGHHWGRGRLVIKQSPEFPWLEGHHWWGGRLVIQQLPELFLVRQAPSQPVLQRLPIGDELVEGQRFAVWPLPFHQSSNQCPRSLQHKDAAIVMVRLSGHAGWRQGGVQQSCERAAEGYLCPLPVPVRRAAPA
ncbi:hypothetical protein ACG873_02620 [Mesorhizobium sp. AaZ16]|uniref:hypothetical protein n=1 Tax=Mesorhizobium sp. AaZ16 TaxID=3402289 RepID=UPI00374E52A0